ncbi:transmembrane protein 98 [Sphaerodactylus townsendi]|nr:transmembrane protein 98 [Sphaerodactylus townsendi]
MDGKEYSCPAVAQREQPGPRRLARAVAKLRSLSIRAHLNSCQLAEMWYGPPGSHYQPVPGLLGLPKGSEGRGSSNTALEQTTFRSDRSFKIPMSNVPSLFPGPIVDLMSTMETQSEPSELELDNVVITNPHIEAILENEDWIEDASGLVSHCIAILKICHTLTEKLVAMTMGSGAQMKLPASLSDIIVVAKRISPRVDDVVRSMYPPLDPKLLDARTTALLLSVSHLVLITRNACHSPSGMDWIDQSLSAAEEHMAVLREAALASEPERVAPGAEGFLQEQSTI